MTNINVDARIEMRAHALEVLKSEHAELWDSWKVVESKAQPIAALAGVFLAGVFAYLGQLPASASSTERFMLLLIAALLVVSAILALAAIWITDVKSPYLSSQGIDEVDDMLREATNAADLDDRHERMIQSAVFRWTAACENIRKGLQRKRDLFSGCLLALSCAGAACLPLAAWMLFGRAP